MKISAVSHPNIAFIKYWGNIDDRLRLPQNGSISMNLGSLETRTSVEFSGQLTHDELTINSEPISGPALSRVTDFMEKIRILSGETLFARIESTNNFPIGAGIASSAAAFSALALAGSTAAGLSLSEEDLSRLARLGSGSASRSIPAGYCEWLCGDDETSSAYSLAPADHWDLVDLIVVLSCQHKKVGSTGGHASAQTSPYQAVRVQTAAERLVECRNAILKCDFPRLAAVSEADSTMMHAVMMTQSPPLFYWEPLSLQVMKSVTEWREEGLPCFSTLDAGPNVHVICPSEVSEAVEMQLRTIPGITEIITSGPGEGARLL